MSDPVLPVGKLPPALLAELLAAGPPPPPELLVPPTPGEDAAVLRVDGGALVAATDPITMVGSGVGRHAVWINANDVAVCGVAPRWFLAAVLLPEGTREDDVRALFAGLRAALEEVGAALVGGHTEVTTAVVQPVVTGQMLGLEPSGHFVRTGGARPGDAIVQVGAAPVEGACVLAAEAADRLASVPAAVRDAAAAAIDDPGISVVAAALRAAELGATALHDPTEGGLATGLHELADASGVALRGIDPDAVPWFEPGLALCRALGADPWGTLASGALLAAFPQAEADAALAALCRATGLPGAILARVEPGAGVTFADGEAVPRFARDELSRVL